MLLALGAGGSADGAEPTPTVLRASFSSFPDYLDPQLSYTAEGWAAMYDTYIPLLTYRHAGGKAGSEVIPGLARNLPRISDGGRKHVLYLRKGLHYSDGRPVRASDFEFSVQRMFRLYSGGFLFFLDIVGAGEFLRTRTGGIRGIAAENRTGKIVVRLTRPRGTFTQELALPFVAHDMAKARRLIAKAKPRDRKITVWGDNESPNEEATAYYAQVLRELGFSVRLKILRADSYFSAIGNISTTDLDTGWSDWFEDYPHPNDFFQPLLSGESIFRHDNSNFTQIDIPSLNWRIAGLRERPRVAESAYAALDRSYMKLAPMAPYGTRLLSTFVSKSIDLDKVVWNPTFGDDLASFQFR